MSFGKIIVSLVRTNLSTNFLQNRTWQVTEYTIPKQNHYYLFNIMRSNWPMLFLLVSHIYKNE